MGRDHAADAADWFAEESEGPTALSRLPVGTWVVTNDEHEKVLRQAGIAPSFESVAHEGKLLLLRKIR
jgi:hypothetical protein